MEEKVEKLKNILEGLFRHLGIDPKFTIDDSQEGVLSVKIWDGDLSFLIGYRGHCLNALKHFLGLTLNRGLDEDGDWVRVSVDIEGYLDRRKERIEEIARNYIDKVRFFGKDVPLPNMISSERFIVHTYVGDYPDVVSKSEGTGFGRHVVLKLISESENISEK